MCMWWRNGIIFSCGPTSTLLVDGVPGENSHRHGERMQTPPRRKSRPGTFLPTCYEATAQWFNTQHRTPKTEKHLQYKSSISYRTLHWPKADVMLSQHVTLHLTFISTQTVNWKGTLEAFSVLYTKKKGQGSSQTASIKRHSVTALNPWKNSVSCPSSHLESAVRSNNVTWTSSACCFDRLRHHIVLCYEATWQLVTDGRSVTCTEVKSLS